MEDLLDPEKTEVVERTIDLPQTGEVILSVLYMPDEEIEVKPQVTLDLVEHAVRAQEQFMGVAYPKSYVIVLISDVLGYTGGAGSRIVLTPSSYDDYGSIAQTIALTYWAAVEDWLQGGAVLLEYVSVGSREGTTLPEETGGCNSVSATLDGEERVASTLAEIMILNEEIRQAKRASGSDDYSNPFARCEYAKGLDLFLELYHGLGGEAFRQGFAELYQTLRSRAFAEECAGLHWGECYLTKAFVTDADPKDSAIAEEIINRRYYGT